MGFLSGFKIFSEKYEFGFPDITGTKPVVISFNNPNEVEFAFRGFFSSKKVILKSNDIIEVGLNQEKYRSAGKAATGAIIGGVLTGGIGLLAGAAIGGKRRKENQLYLLVNYMNTECEITLTPSKNMPAIYAEFKKLMSIKEEKSMKETDNNEPKDIVSELERLYSLVEKGILTREEFEIQKKKIIV